MKPSEALANAGVLHARRLKPSEALANAGVLRARRSKRGVARIGISGWLYPSWRGVFYPRGLRQADELAYASRAVDSIEVNG